jgi:transcriptional regulator with GAF, ATPase, and Fis domain
VALSDEQFIQEATQCLYSDLNIENALFSAFNYLKKYFPLDLTHMFIYDMSRDALRYLALATEKRGVLIDETIRISSRAKEEFQGYTAGGVYTYSKSGSVLIQEIFGHFQRNTRRPLIRDDEEFSSLGIVLDIGMYLVGGYSMVALGENRYGEEHKRKLKLLGGVLTGSVLNLLHHREIVSQNERLTREKDLLRKRLGHGNVHEIIGADSGMRDVTALVRHVAGTPSPVLITGETGVGKELIANLIHRESGRKGPFICVNCGAIPETLIDSELFGHEKGAFTGAIDLKRGYFEQADGGTIFLDEVGELPLASQVRFLRVIQSMEFQRVGGQRPISVDVRIIAATNRNLLTMARDNRFREDLWFRLSVFPIKIPPLRDRREDIPEMALHFVTQKARELNLGVRPAISKKAMEQLVAYDWPGNIRELQNVIERALIVSNGEALRFPNLAAETARTGTAATEKGIPKIPTMDEMTVNLINQALTLCGGRINGKDGAARMLGMNPSTLRGRMRKYGIKTERIVRLEDPGNIFS